MQFINIIYTNQQIFHSIIFLLKNVILIIRVLKPSAISNQWRPLESCWVKTTFLSDEQHLIFYFLRTREGHMPTITESREDCCQDNLHQANLIETATDRNRVVESPAMVDLAYLIAGLVTTTQFRLVHRMLQGVEHTDPTEWSTSHLSIRDKLYQLFYERLILQEVVFHFQSAPQHFIFRRLRHISFSNGYATFHFIDGMGFILKWS